MWWFKKRPEKPLRDQLLEARDSLRRQIEILDAGPARNEPGEADYMRGQAAELRTMLDDIEGQLADPDADQR